MKNPIFEHFYAHFPILSHERLKIPTTLIKIDETIFKLILNSNSGENIIIVFSILLGRNKNNSAQ